MKFKDGFYIIKKGTKIYRGDNRLHLGENTWERIKSRPTFFALTQEVAEQEYGVTYEFVTDKKYTLLALDHKETIQSLLDIPSIPYNIKRILEINYGGKSTRLSNLEDDLKLTDYLCKSGFEGYATKKLETDFSGHFHPEIMICNPNEIHLPNKVTIDEEKIQKIISEYKEKRIARRLKEDRDAKRKQKNNYGYDDDNNYGNNYGYDDNNNYGFPMISSSPPPPPSRLFSYDSPPIQPPSRLFSYDSPPIHVPQAPLFSYDSPLSSHKKSKRKYSTPSKGGKKEKGKGKNTKKNRKQ
jgi:hypothetical protein